MIALILICGLAVARLTRLWRDDKFMEGARWWVQGLLTDSITTTYRRGDRLREWIDSMLGCPWCFSGWLSLFAVILVDSATSRSVDLPVLAWLVTWYIANLGYWLLELVADRDALLWHEREEKDLT